MSTNRRPQPTVDLGYPTEPYGPIPAFNSIEEEAEYWDTHDFTDFSELTDADFDEEVGAVERGRNPEFGEDLPVRLVSKDREALERRAEELGVEPAELVRMWVEERLHKEAS